MARIINTNIAGGSSATPSGWYPPSDWPMSELDDITDGDNGFIGFAIVYENGRSAVSFQLNYTGGGGTIDWGDGNTDTLGLSGTINEHDYDYSHLASSPVQVKGYKIAVVKIKITGVVTAFVFSQPITDIGTVYNYSTQWLAIKLRTTVSTVNYSHNNPYMAGNLEYLDCGDTVPFNSIYFKFRGHSALNYIKWKAPIVSGLGSSAFRYNKYPSENTKISAFNMNDINWDLITSMFGTFYCAQGHCGKFEQSISTCTNLTSTFRASQAFNEVILTNTGLVTDISYCLYQNGTSYFSMDDCSSITTTTGFVINHDAYGQLTGLILSGLTVGINISLQSMDATALNAFFTSLGTASGSQTITVTGNPGAATCDTSIATGKGWTVTT